MDTNSQDIEEQLLGITQQLLIDLHNVRATRALSLHADLERHLGIGSIEKAELFHRIEKQFDIQLPEALLSEADTLQDLVDAIREAHPYIKPVSFAHYPKVSESHVDPTKATTLLELLETYASKEEDRPHIFLQDDQGNEKIITYGLLNKIAKKVAGGLQKLGLKPDQTVAIMLPTGEEFFYAFFGVLMAGGIPVPIYPPFRAKKLEEYIQRESKILSNAETYTLISFHEVTKLSQLLKSFVRPLKHITTINDLLHIDGKVKTIKRKREDGALIQYTSGSTGDPKGVYLTNYNLLTNIRTYGEAIGAKPTDIVVSWLPLYHDMGLIGTWLGSLYYGIPVVILSPLTFLTHPEKWLWAIHYHQATITASPNFGYELCLSKIPDRALEGLDLNSLRAGFNGAETVYASTIRNFTKRFENYGLKPNTIQPVYGLAENSVALTIPTIEQPVKIEKVKRHIFDSQQIAQLADKHEKDFHEFPSCGKPLPEHEIRIVDEDNNLLPDRKVGRLQFKGPSAMQEYYHNPEATAKVIHNGWFDTGDYAYIANGELFVTGREKDIIIKAGRNLYPAEIEEIAGEVSGIRKGCVVAFGAHEHGKGTEQFVIIAESHSKDEAEKIKISDNIVEQVATVMGIPPDIVIIAEPGTVLKTSSGKLRRSATKDAYLKRKLKKRTLPATVQYLKLKLTGISKKIKLLFTQAFKLLYTVYFLTFGLSTGIFIWLLTLLTPKPATFYLLKYWSRLMFLWGFCPIKFDKKQLPSTKKPLIFIANHASYMDSILLISLLPKDVLFIGKKELLKLPLIHTFIKRLGYPVIDRVDFSKSISDTQALKDALKANKSILIFPEGTFAAAKGVRPFKLGAFKLSIETGVALCPIAIKGTRRLLRAKHKLFMPSNLSIWIGEPISPKDDDFSEAIRLRNELRDIISEHCDEAKIQLLRAGPEGR